MAFPAIIALPHTKRSVSWRVPVPLEVAFMVLLVERPHAARCVACHARRISLRIASARLNSTRTTDHASTLAPSRVEHHAQGAVDAEPRVPEAGVNGAHLPKARSDFFRSSIRRDAASIHAETWRAPSVKEAASGCAFMQLS
jgi:hypothetical protein